MSPAHLAGMVRVETRGALTRGAGVASLIVGLGVGLLVLVVAKVALGMAVQVTDANGVPSAAFSEFNGVEAAAWALRARNFFVLPLFLLLVTGSSFAGELADHTFRELLVRPVPRWAVVFSKVSALMALSGATLVLTLVPALVGGSLLFGTGGDMGRLALGYLASWLSDLGLISLGVLVSTFVRGSGGVVVAVIGLLMADLAARGALKVGSMVLQHEALGAAGAYLPGAALAAWEGWRDGFELAPFGGLALLVGICLGGALWRIQRMDVP